MKRMALLIFLMTCSPSEALYVSIENIGSKPIVSVNMGFIVEGSHFQIWSLLHPDPTNYLLQIGWDTPIKPGETYNTPLIPELTGVGFNFCSYGVSGPWIGTGGDGHIIRNVIPDVSSWISYNETLDFGEIFSFHSGGSVAPVPEPASALLVMAGLAGLVMLGRRSDGRSGSGV